MSADVIGQLVTLGIVLLILGLVVAAALFTRR